MPRPMQIKGADHLMDRLKSLSKTGGKRALRGATNSAGRVLKNAVKAAVPVDDGLLKKAQDSKTVARGYRMTAIIGANVAKLQAHHGADINRPTNIDHLVEFGHTTPDGRNVPPNGYMRRASDSAMPSAERVFAAKLAEGIEREAMR